MPTNFAVTPTSTTVLGTNDFPVSAVFVPGTASGNLTALQGGPASTDGNGYTSAPMVVYQATGTNLHTVVDSGTLTANQGGSWTVTANAGSGTFTNQQTNITSDYDSSAGTQLLTMFGFALPASGGAVPGGTTANPLRIDPTGTTTQPVSGSVTVAGTVTANAGTGNFTVVQATGTNLHTVVDSGTVTANIGTTAGIALDATVSKLTVAQATALGSTTGPMAQGSVSTGAPTYTTGTINPLSLTTAGALRIDGSGATQPVSGSVSVSNFPATQPISGTVTANQGGAPWSTNVTQFGGSNVATGTGASGAGIPRVTVANDSNVLATQSGTWAEQPVAGTTGGATTTHLVSASGNNATNTKASAGLLYGFSISNTNAAARYVHFYNKATAPVVGTDVPVATVQVPGNGVVIRAFPVGATYGTGIGFGTSTGAGDTDSGAIGAGDLVIDLEYK